MGFEQQGFEDTFIGLYLPLQLRVDLRPHAWLLVVWEYIKKVDRIPVSAQERSAQSTLLPSVCQRLFHIVLSSVAMMPELLATLCTGKAGISPSSSADSITAATSVSTSLNTLPT